jgi:antitoxin component of RelBE/YafQ-DinJ toxin-antitoxin module
MNTHETYIKFRVSDELKAEMKKAANAKGIDLSGWLRMIAITAISAENERGKGSERGWLSMGM